MVLSGVKHLNPRQGITTPFHSGFSEHSHTDKSVKHLNPRQGITNRMPLRDDPRRDTATCETPKSPPGDYKLEALLSSDVTTHHLCETPKSPPGDYKPLFLPKPSAALLTPSV